TQDENNLKQLCLATINAADTNGGKLPPLVGPYPGPDSTAQGNGYGSLFFHILPYLEQDNLYKSAYDGKTYRADTTGVQATVVKVSLPPPAPGEGKDPVPAGWLAKCNYPANSQVFGARGKNSLAGQSRFPASIPDGTSNTLFFAQRYQNCNAD